MDDTLQPISIKLSRLEKTLLEAYSRTRAESSSELLYIVLPREQARSHLATLKTLHDELLGTADSGKLQLVTDLHDELRIRMIVLRDLLEREIPIPYLERVLAELKDPAQIAAPPPRRVNQDREKAEPSRPSGLFGWLFPRKSATTPTRHSSRTPTTDPAPERPEQPLPSQEVMQTFGLHYLMEEDQLKLVKSGQELPRVTHGLGLPPTLSRFVARDLSEAHFASRAYPRVARTPEELRRKLSEKSD